MAKLKSRKDELRKKTTEDLRAELLALHREAFNLRMQKTVQQTKSPASCGGCAATLLVL